MKVVPFYSKVRGLAVEDLWHNNDECEIGLSIALVDRRTGEGTLRRPCPYCNVLNQPRGKATCW